MQRSSSATQANEQFGLTPDPARQRRLRKPLNPVRSYTVILLGLLMFTVALVVFLIAHSPRQ
jgi:hypothetical protein